LRKHKLVLIRWLYEIGSSRMHWRTVGSNGNSDDNALAEAINGLYKVGLIHGRAAWKTRDAVQWAPLEWVA
jgi:hypothetical protein